MKKLLIILMVFLIFFGFCGIVKAQPIDNFLNFGNIDVLVKTSSTIDIFEGGDEPSLEEMTTRLLFKPFDTEQQTIIDLDVIYNNDAEIENKEEEIVYTWKAVDLGRLKFGHEAKVRVNNKFSIISNKVKFPIQNLDSNLIGYVKPGEKIIISESISKKASEIVAGEDDLFNIVYKLAEWNNENIKYDLNTLTEKAVQDSQWVFDNKQGVCDELTNLFISMVRSLGVPARFISGTVYTNDLYDWGPHGWAEVYFPGVGWVPYDPTFGQYGYVDPGHIKMKNSFDSSEPAIKYTWVSRDIKVKTSELDIDVELLKTDGVFVSPIELDIKVLKNKVGFNSYIPLRVTVRNDNNYYVASTIYVTKGPGLEGGNRRSVSLEPKSEKDVYFIIKVPERKEEYVYTSEIEVKDSFGKVANDILEYASNYEVYTLEKAESRVEKLDEGEGLRSFILLDCKSDKDEYYEYETADFTCVIENLGDNELEDLDVCLNGNCQSLSLDVSDKRELKFLQEKVNEDLFIIAKNEDVVKYNYPGFNFLKIPKVEIRNIKVTQPLKYDEIGNVSFLVEPDSDVYNAKIVVGEDLGKLEINEFSVGRSMVVPFYSFKLKVGNNDVDIKVIYEDKNGKSYEAVESFSVDVENVNFFKKVLIFCKRVFSRI